jgi:CHAD domain-containing protein
MLEQERKYDVDDEFTLPDLTGITGVDRVGEAVEHQLEATYFDTVDHRLAALDVLLRRRTGGEDDGWHLKVPSAVDDEARHETRIGLGRAVRTVPRQLRTHVAGLTGDQELLPVARVTTHRTVRPLLDEAGSVLAEVADDRVQAYAITASEPEPGDQDLLQWREIEVELVDGGTKVLRKVGDRLERAGARRSGRRSKLSEVLGGPGAEPVAPSRGKDRVQLLVQHRLATQLDELRRRDPAARQDLPEGVHTMRVAVRRLRSMLATSRPFLDRTVTDPLRDELAWLSDALGAARDAEVRRSRLDAAASALVEERPDIDWDEARVRGMLWSSLVERHGTALEELAAVLTSDRYASLLDRLRDLAADPPWTAKSRKRIRGAYRRRAGRELQRLDRRMQLAADPALTQEERAHALHEARKAAKRARYAVEPLVPVYGEAADTLRKRLKKLQSTLGQHQDTVVTRAHLLDLARSGPDLDPRAALMAGALVEREAMNAERYERRVARAWSKAADVPLPQ